MNADGEQAGNGPAGDDGRDGAAELVISTAWAAQCGGPRVVLMAGLSVAAGRTYLCGRAVTCACVPEDNLAVHVALYQAPPGSVIVADGGGTRRCGLFGELMATDAASRGLAGVVIGGSVRDLDELDRIGLPVRAAGTGPGRADKQALISVGQPVVVGGVLVRPGDQIIADRDGVAVVPAADWPGVRAEAAALAGREAEVSHRLTAGERLADVIGLDLGPYLQHS